MACGVTFDVKNALELRIGFDFWVRAGRACIRWYTLNVIMLMSGGAPRMILGSCWRVQ